LFSDDACICHLVHEKYVFSSLFTRPSSTAPYIDDDQMTPVRMYNSRTNSTPLNTHEARRSAIFTTVHSERCFYKKNFHKLPLLYIYIFFSFAFILSTIPLAIPLLTYFAVYINIISA
jgi:hypothetical protein